MRRIAPGVYSSPDGTMHLDVPELLQDAGYPDTPENRETLTRVAIEMIRERFPEIPVTLTEAPL